MIFRIQSSDFVLGKKKERFISLNRTGYRLNHFQKLKKKQ